MRSSGCTGPTGIKWGELAYTSWSIEGQLSTVGSSLWTIVTIFLGITEFGERSKIRAMNFGSVGLPVHGVLKVRTVEFFKFCFVFLDLQSLTSNGYLTHIW